MKRLVTITTLAFTGVAVVLWAMVAAGLMAATVVIDMVASEWKR